VEVGLFVVVDVLRITGREDGAVRLSRKMMIEARSRGERVTIQRDEKALRDG